MKLFARPVLIYSFSALLALSTVAGGVALTDKNLSYPSGRHYFNSGLKTKSQAAQARSMPSYSAVSEAPSKSHSAKMTRETSAKPPTYLPLTNDTPSISSWQSKSEQPLITPARIIPETEQVKIIPNIPDPLPANSHLDPKPQTNPTQNTDLPAPKSSGIRGRVIIGGCTAVGINLETSERSGVCSSGPYQTSVLIADTKGGILDQVITKDDGTFEIVLSPGEYLLSVGGFMFNSSFTHPRPALGVLPAPVHAVVSESQFSDVVLDVDNGVRVPDRLNPLATPSTIPPSGQNQPPVAQFDNQPPQVIEIAPKRVGNKIFAHVKTDKPALIVLSSMNTCNGEVCFGWIAAIAPPTDPSQLVTETDLFLVDLDAGPPPSEIRFTVTTIDFALKTAGFSYRYNPVTNIITSN